MRAAAWSAQNRSRGTFLGAVGTADSFVRRMLGLHARETSTRDGLWLVPCRGIQTIGMRRAIDVVFLDAANRVVRVDTGLPPGRIIWWVRRARSVLELPAGAAERSGTQIGDSIELVSA
jgi:uncharacterized protein